MTVTKLRYLILLFVCMPLMAQMNVVKRYSQLNAQYSTKLDGSTQYFTKSNPMNMDLNGTEILSKGGVVFTFDDGYISDYTIAYPIMSARGIKGTVYIIAASTIDWTMNVAQQQELYAAGWDMANHTNSHPNLSILSEAEQETEIDGCIDTLIARSMPRAAYHVAFPGGLFNEFTNAALATTGIITARITGATAIDPLNYTLYRLNGYAVSSSTLMATLQAFIISAVNQGKLVALYFHNIGGTNEMTADNFTNLCDFINTQKIPTYTITEAYSLISENRGFEISKGDWADNGNHSATMSTTYAKSGTGSLKIVSTDAGDATTNFLSLPYTSFATPIISGNKYTMECWSYSDGVGITLAVKIGDQLVTGKTVYNATAGRFVKQVFNFQATVNTVNQPIQLYLSGATNCYIDNLSLTPAYDMLVFAKIKTSTKDAGIFGLQTTLKPRFCVTLNNTIGDARPYLADDTITATGGNNQPIADLSDNLWDVSICTVDRIGLATTYKNGVAGAGTVSVTNIGKSLFTLFEIGTATNLFGKLNGLNSEVQVVRFNSFPSDIASIANQIGVTGKPLSAYPTGQIVGWWDWKQGGYDKSGNGNHLTNIGSAPIVRVK